MYIPKEMNTTNFDKKAFNGNYGPVYLAYGFIALVILIVVQAMI